MDRVVDERSWLKDLGQCQPPVRVGDRDEANMKVLACAGGTIEAAVGSWFASGLLSLSGRLRGVPGASRIAHAGLPFANPMSETAVDAAIAALTLPATPLVLDT